MTNREWLYSLQPAELAAWFEAEHADELHDVAHESERVTKTVGMSLEKLQRENMALARDLGECMAERDELRARRSCPGYDADAHSCRYHAVDFELTREAVNMLKRENRDLQRAYDEITGIAADLCRACGFSMVDAAGEAVG